MQLGDILDDVTLDVVTGSIEIARVDCDSRSCMPGSLFFAMPGRVSQGSRFANDAVARGALCVVACEPIIGLVVPVVIVPSTQLHALCAHASAVITGDPELRTQLVGVTGTNGKTTVTTLVASLVRSLGWNGANIGTLTNERTTPAAPELFRTLASLVADFDPRAQRSVVAMEVSSHAIDQQRIEGLMFTVAAFTNLSHDHLDYHETMEGYFATKGRLFTPEHAQRAVIWADDPYGERLAELTSLPVTRVNRGDAVNVQSTLGGTTYFWRQHLVNTTLVGDYNVDNALMAMTIVSVLGASDADVAAAMGDVTSVPGRFEVIAGGRCTVIVDYAHTPAGLLRLLEDVRALMPIGRMITVFGCGGDRDREKRPEMGRVASLLSDETIVTSDNPRSESPDAIIDAIMSGVVPGASVHRLRDRREAIARAIELASRGDVVVLAGKGHETTQTIADQILPFDDREVAKELLK
jgi:UDP-N-acetylmuramoyl-L-alanyl-D-glutamate--2,6-diaminopimelate ligase